MSDVWFSTGITDKGLAEIGSGLPSLQSLDVSYCRKLTDKGLSSVAHGCHDMRALHVAGCRLITDALLKALANNCNNLEELGMQGCTNLTDTGLTVLVGGCNRLKHIDLNKCSNVSDMGVINISNACSSSLLTFKLLDCYKIGDKSIMSLARWCNNLETVIIGGCRNLSDESIKSLASACNHSLKILRMDWCSKVSDASLDCIFFECRQLEVLDIGCCEEVTDAAFDGLGIDDSKLNLKILRVSNCQKITIHGISKLLKSCQALEYLDVRSCPNITEVGCRQAGLMFPGGCKVNFVGSLAEPDLLR